MTTVLPTLLITMVAGQLSEAPGTQSEPSRALLRRIIGETAVAQLENVDPSWQPEQRDCAGLIRFAYRAAYKALAPEKVARGLWRDNRGRRVAFADAETLVTSNFTLLGRGPETLDQVESGDVIAFRHHALSASGPVFHLMLVLRADDPAHGDAHVIYHPGSPGVGLRMGALRDLLKDAPHEWRPASDNPFFLGFFRYREWIHD